MNEKLTPELRDWIRMAVGVARGSNTGIAWAEFYTQLYAHTTEDEGLPPVLIYRDGDFVRAETDEEITLRKIEEYCKEIHGRYNPDGGYRGMIVLGHLKDWLQQGG